MLNSLITIDELLNAKEGEHYQFKEAKRRFDSDEAAPDLLRSCQLWRRHAGSWHHGQTAPQGRRQRGI